MAKRKSEIVDYLRIWGSITNVGQIDARKRRELDRLATKGVVAKTQIFSYPIPKTRYVWIGEAE